MPESMNQKSSREGLRIAGSAFSWIFWSLYFLNFYLITSKLINTSLTYLNLIRGVDNGGQTVDSASYGIWLNMRVFLFGSLLLILWYTLLRPFWKKLINPVSP